MRLPKWHAANIRALQRKLAQNVTGGQINGR
jgi:hypothetical protein